MCTALSAGSSALSVGSSAKPLDLDDEHEVIRRVDQDSRVHESRQLLLACRAQAGEVLPRRVVKVPAVHASETAALRLMASVAGSSGETAQLPVHCGLARSASVD